MLDIAIAAMVFGFILGLLFPKALGMPSALLGLLIVFAWIFVETALLASWGTTPGKWLLGVGVRTAAGAKLSAGAALRRSFDVWLRGLGGGIPLVSLLTTVKAYKRLKERRQTAWDAAGSFVVSHEPLRAVRIVLAVLLLLVWAGLVVVGSQS